MKKNIKYIFCIITLFFVAEIAQAQWTLGLTYQVRSEDPKYGYGFHLRRVFNLTVPQLKLGGSIDYVRYSENKFSLDVGDITDNVTAAIDDYEIHFTGLAQVSLGLVSVYGGFGIGLGAVEFSDVNNQNDGDDAINNDVFTFYKATVGGSTNIIPILTPFIEINYRGFENFDLEVIKKSKYNIVFGIGVSI